MLYHLLYPLREYFHVLNVFKYSTFRSVYAVLTAILISFLIGKFIINKLKKLNIGQNIREDGPRSHLNKTGTPTMGGIIILISLFISTVLWARLDNSFIIVVLASTLWFGIVGFTDDYLKINRKSSRGLNMKLKLILQFIGAIAIAVYLYHNPASVLYPTHVKLPLIRYPVDFSFMYFPFIILVIVGASNAVNLTDGLDGLAIGSFLFTAIALSVVVYLVGHSKFSNYLGIVYIREASELAVFCACLVGTGLGFLWFNSYPASVFMGDVGSLSLGGALGTVAVLTKQELLLVLIGGIFVVEAVSVIIQVLSFKLSGKRVFKMAPLHHHFELCGIPESKIVVRFWIIAIIIALGSLSLLKLR